MDFNEAVTRVREGDLPTRSIGVLKEKPLHATLKWWLDDNPDHHEITLSCGKVADIYDGTTVTEVQTGSFSPLRKKLEVLLPHYPVTVVHPLVRRKYVSWIDPVAGTVTEPRKSPRFGSFTDGGKQLIYLLPLLSHPHLTVRLVLIDAEEQRVMKVDKKGNTYKRFSHRAVLLPLSVEDTLDLRCPADYAALIPAGLPATFTAAQFGKAAKMQGRNLSGTLKVLLDRGVIARTGKEGNAWIYARV
jgi:endonuclease YncB( thermonuclease family)